MSNDYIDCGRCGTRNFKSKYDIRQEFLTKMFYFLIGCLVGITFWFLILRIMIWRILG